MENNIVLLTDSLGAGGAQRQLVGLAKMLNSRGYNITVLTYYNQSFYKSFLDEHHVRNVLLDDAISPLKRIAKVYNFLKSIKPHIVIAYQETPSLIACLCKVLGCKYNLIVSERNTTQHIGFNERLRFFLYHYADKIVPNSYSQEKTLKNNYFWMRKKMKTIINFVDLDVFNIKPHIRNEVPVIMVAASIWPPKNTLGFLQACKILNDRGVCYKVEWYGLVDVCADYSKLCMQYIADNKLDNVQLLQKTQNIVDKYHKADYLCLPSFYEGTPNVICEAIACGKPVICSNVCDNGIYVKESYTGFLFDPFNPKDIAQKIENAISVSDVEFYLMSSNCRKISEEKFSKERFVTDYENIIKEL